MSPKRKSKERAAPENGNKPKRPQAKHVKQLIWLRDGKPTGGTEA